MSKGAKKILGTVIIIILVLAVIWLVYESVKAEPAQINETNELPNENMGIDNVINELYDEEETNTTEEEIKKEDNSKEENVDKQTEEKNQSSNSEVVSGTKTSREEKAVELAKEYYETEYDNVEDVYFRCDTVNTNGDYVVIASNNGVTLAYLIVDLATETVTEK
jgi:rRNA maturation endonuclease Nob1